MTRKHKPFFPPKFKFSKLQTVAFFAVLTFASTTVMLADLYSPGPDTTDLQGQWIDATTTPQGGPPVYGTPGPNDDVDLQGFDITASGGKVHRIYDLGSLSVTGTASAFEASQFTLRGSGTLKVDHVDPISGLAVVGGHLKASLGADFVDVSAGGSVSANTCKGGSFRDGSSLTFTGTGGSGSGGSASFFSGSTLTATDFGLTNFTLTLNSGCAALVRDYEILNTGGAFVNGPNASLVVSSTFLIESGNLALGSGGTATVQNVSAPGGQILVDGSQSVLTALQDISITGGDLQVSNQGVARAKGKLNMSRGHIGARDGGFLEVDQITLGGDPDNVSAIVDVDRGLLFDQTASVSGGSQITINQNGVLNVQNDGQAVAVGLFVTGGTLNISTLGEVTFNSPGTLEVRSLGSVTVSGGKLLPDSVLVDNSKIDVNGGGSVKADLLDNHGQVSVSGDGSLLTFKEVKLADSLSGSDSAVTLGTSDKAKILIASTLTIEVPGGVGTLAGGSIEIGTVSAPALDGEIRVGSGGTLKDNGAVTCKQAFIENQGILYGTGTINGKTFSSGRLFPGNSPGIFSVQGDYTQNSDGLLGIEIGGTDAGTGYDQLQVSGAASIAGNLQVRLVNGFTPTVGQTYRIVNAGSFSGSFSSIVQPSQAGISIANDATGIIVTITSVVAGAPVISSATTVAGTQEQAFSYQITATNNPMSFGAMNLPDGLTVNQTSGVISGTPTTAGNYVVPMAANNDAGSGQADLIIAVDLPPVTKPPQLLNISTRMRVLPGDNALIGGFIITGTEPKKVIIRGIGPSLGALGVSGTLADPTLELHQGSTTLATNDNWKTGPDGSSQQAEVEATTLPPTNDSESAIVTTLIPGAYTAILADKNGSTGVGVMEIFDLAQEASSKLGNISSRGFVDTGDNVMIGGFIVGGEANAAVVVRGIGPSLAQFGLNSVLADPTLALHDANGTTLVANDDWNDDPSAAAQLTANGLALQDPKESGIFTTLPPGQFTAVLAGKNGGIGLALVEIYHLN